MRKVCKPRQVSGISEKKRSFHVTQYIYNCQNLNINDAPLLIDAIKSASINGVYIDPFADEQSKAAKKAVLEPVEPVNDSINTQYGILKEYGRGDYNIIRLSESELRHIIHESVKDVLLSSR